jgi:hypothetical protein
METAYEQYAAKIKAIDKELYAAKKAEMTQELTAWYDSQKQLIAADYDAQKENLSQKLKSVKEYYDGIDREEARQKRSGDLEELRYLESIYRNHATKEGQDEYKRILEQIDQLESENRRDARQTAETEIQTRIDAVDEQQKAALAALDADYERRKEDIDKLAKEAAVSFDSAGAALVDGLTGMFSDYHDGFGAFKDDVLKQTDELVAGIKSRLSALSAPLAGVLGALGGASSVVNNNKTNSVTLNDYGAKTFNTPVDLAQYLNELSTTALYGLNGR